MSDVIVLSGSPSLRSKTAAMGDHVVELLREQGMDATALRLRELSPRALLSGDCSEPGLADALQSVAEATGIVIATPVFKASFSGLLKAFLDLLPQFGFTGKVVLPLATGGSLAHVLALDYGLRPVLQSMNPAHIVQGYFMWEKWIDMSAGLRMDEDARRNLAAAVAVFQRSLRQHTPAALADQGV